MGKGEHVHRSVDFSPREKLLANLRISESAARGWVPVALIRVD